MPIKPLLRASIHAVSHFVWFDFNPEKTEKVLNISTVCATDYEPSRENVKSLVQAAERN